MCTVSRRNETAGSSCLNALFIVRGVFSAFASPTRRRARSASKEGARITPEQYFNTVCLLSKWVSRFRKACFNSGWTSPTLETKKKKKKNDWRVFLAKNRWVLKIEKKKMLQLLCIVSAYEYIWQISPYLITSFSTTPPHASAVRRAPVVPRLVVALCWRSFSRTLRSAPRYHGTSPSRVLPGLIRLPPPPPPHPHPAATKVRLWITCRLWMLLKHLRLSPIQ